MELIDRFRYIIKINQMTPTSFADEIGVQRSSVSHVLSGRNKPSMEFIQKILQRFPKVDAAWLISGSKDGQVPMNLGEHIASDTESPAEYNNKTSSDPAHRNENPHENNSKKVVKVLVFYDDSTFEEFRKG